MKDTVRSASDSTAAAPAGGRESAGTDLLLVVRLGAGRYALPLASVADVARCGPLRPVPGAPECVLGLAERHGRVVTVLDLARLIGEAPVAGDRCLVRLARPLDHLALAVPSAPRHLTLAEGASREGVLDPDRPPVLLDPERLLAKAESGMPGAPRTR
jgi:chemotaxis signal transduction protein